VGQTPVRTTLTSEEGSMDLPSTNKRGHIGFSPPRGLEPHSSTKKDCVAASLENEPGSTDSYRAAANSDPSIVKRIASPLDAPETSNAKKLELDAYREKAVEIARLCYRNSGKLQQKRREDHELTLPFILIIDKNKTIPASDFVQLNKIAQIRERVYAIPCAKIEDDSVLVALPGSEELKFIGTYEQLIKDAADAAFFEDLSGGTQGELRTDVGPYIQAVTLACACLAYRFGWIISKSENLVHNVADKISPEFKSYGFAFAMQHATIKQREDMVKYCLDQGGSPLYGHRVEDDLHTISPLEVACLKNNSALISLMLKKLSAHTDACEIRKVFSNEHGWAEIPAPIARFLESHSGQDTALPRACG
jgi:hypothetical protein